MHKLLTNFLLFNVLCSVYLNNYVRAVHSTNRDVLQYIHYSRSIDANRINQQVPRPIFPRAELLCRTLSTTRFDNCGNDNVVIAKLSGIFSCSLTTVRLKLYRGTILMASHDINLSEEHNLLTQIVLWGSKFGDIMTRLINSDVPMKTLYIAADGRYLNVDSEFNRERILSTIPSYVSPTIPEDEYILHFNFLDVFNNDQSYWKAKNCVYDGAYFMAFILGEIDRRLMIHNYVATKNSDDDDQSTVTQSTDSTSENTESSSSQEPASSPETESTNTEETTPPSEEEPSTAPPNTVGGNTDIVTNVSLRAYGSGFTPYMFSLIAKKGLFTFYRPEILNFTHITSFEPYGPWFDNLSPIPFRLNANDTYYSMSYINTHLGSLRVNTNVNYSTTPNPDVQYSEYTNLPDSYYNTNEEIPDWVLSSTNYGYRTDILNDNYFYLSQGNLDGNSSTYPYDYSTAPLNRVPVANIIIFTPKIKTEQNFGCTQFGNLACSVAEGIESFIALNRMETIRNETKHNWIGLCDKNSMNTRRNSYQYGECNSRYYSYSSYTNLTEPTNSTKLYGVLNYSVS